MKNRILPGAWPPLNRILKITFFTGGTRFLDQWPFGGPGGSPFAFKLNGGGQKTSKLMKNRFWPGAWPPLKRRLKISCFSTGARFVKIPSARNLHSWFLNQKTLSTIFRETKKGAREGIPRRASDPKIPKEPSAALLQACVVSNVTHRRPSFLESECGCRKCVSAQTI